MYIGIYRVWFSADDGDAAVRKSIDCMYEEVVNPIYADPTE